MTDSAADVERAPRESAYARNSRPWIARHAFAAAAAYVAITELARVAGEFTGHQVAGADGSVLAALLTPVAWYMSVRTIDGFSKEGRTQ